MKKVLFMIILWVNLSYSQTPGDCPETATQITECGITYTGNNASFTDNCGGDMCGCVGGNSNPSNFDNDCNTVYSGGNCGSDFAGSIENSMWWKFTPTEDCDYEISITPYNCCCAQGNGPDFMQVWIGQMSGGSVTSYLVNDNSNTNLTGGITTTYTVPISISDGDVFIMLDGNAGAECDLDVSIQPSSNCGDLCPIILNSELLEFKGENNGNYNRISWRFADNEFSKYELQKSENAITWCTIKYYESDLQYHNYIDIADGLTYYRLIGEVSSQMIAINSNKQSELKIIRYLSMYGIEINDIENYNGTYIIMYSNGTFVKNVK
jgi:hypothetical protein